MKRLVLTLTILFAVGSLLSCSKKESRVADTNLTKVEAKSGSQQEEIYQLQETIRQQQDEIDQLKAKLPSSQEDDPVAMALFMKYGRCGKVDIDGDVVKIYLCSIRAVASFIDTDPKNHAVSDLNFFLTEKGLETGTIEYYTKRGAIVFSISGSLKSAETEMYY